MLVFADDVADRAKIAGAWQQSEDAKVMWALQDKGDSMHIKHAVGGQSVVEFDCSTTGSECKVKDAGKKATISMWFLGPKLVVLETKGNEIVKRRFIPASQADQLEMEVIPIVPAGKTETLHFKRVQAAVQQ
jgi:hypothetical protein